MTAQGVRFQPVSAQRASHQCVCGAQRGVVRAWLDGD